MPEKWTSMVKGEVIKTLVSALEKLEAENKELRDKVDEKPTSADVSDEQLRDEVAKLNAMLFGDDYEPNSRDNGNKDER